MRALEPRRFEIAKSGEELDMCDVTVIMPIGGMGIRAREVTQDIIPKPLIELEKDRTILDTICESLQDVGFRRFVFCVGHHKEQIIDRLSAERWIHAEGVNYLFSEEDTPLGVEGAVLNAVQALGLKGQAMIVAGDMLHDWEALVGMNREHKSSGAGVTMGTTTYITKTTVDIDRLVAEEGTNRLIWTYGRTEKPVTGIRGAKNLTSIGVNIIDVEYFQELCRQFLEANPHERQNIGLRDTVGPWAIRMGGLALHTYDTRSEQVDLGTPENIRYGQANWRTLNK